MKIPMLLTYLKYLKIVFQTINKNYQQINLNPKLKIKQIYYELDCSALMCFFQIKINDFEVFSFNVDGQSSMDVPINQAIFQSGTPEIEVRVFPLSGTKILHKDAYLRYKLIEFDVSSGDFKFISQLENQQTPPVQKGVPFTMDMQIKSGDSVKRHFYKYLFDY